MTTLGSSRSAATQSAVTSFSGWAYSASSGDGSFSTGMVTSLGPNGGGTRPVRLSGHQRDPDPPEAGPHRRPVLRRPQGPAPAGPAGVLPQGAAAARPPRRPARQDGAGRRVPDAVLPRHRGRRRPAG